MGTILPRLTGAQARARDTARKADLSNISQALELYYNDTGSYPSAKDGTCLDPAATSNDSDPKKIAYTLGTYMKGGKVPAAASKNQTMFTGKLCTGQYYYQSLSSSGIADASYILASSVETWQMGNFKVSLGGNSIQGNANPTVATPPVGYEASENFSPAALKVKSASGKLAIYVVMP